MQKVAPPRHGRHPLCPSPDPRFAEAQRASMVDIEVETLPRVILGHRKHPRAVRGLLRPGGKFPMVASAHMSVLTASVAGVPRIVRLRATGEGRAATPPSWPRCTWGARTRSTSSAASRPWAPGARDRDDRPRPHARGPRKRIRRGSQAPALRPRRHRPLRRPTETMLIADDTVDAELLRDRPPRAGRARYNSPACLITTSGSSPKARWRTVDRLLGISPRRDARVSWRDYGGHPLRHARGDAQRRERHGLRTRAGHDRRDDWYHENMTAYGALFLGPRTNVANGDKVIGTNHTLPTKKAGRYTAASGSASSSRPTATRRS